MPANLFNCAAQPLGIDILTQRIAAWRTLPRT
jgi:hypothetical protein